ncbi:MAG: hypothetical protein ACFFCD_02105 [Promethearchaeota archaeon]
MVKTKSIEEYVENYVIGTIQGMLKTKRYWLRRGFSINRATENAMKYGVGQLSVGVGTTVTLKQAEGLFRELADLANEMADLCTS